MTHFNDIPHSEQEEEHSSGYFVVVSSPLVEDSRLSPRDVMLMLHISNFLRRDGYAICSDAWLAKKQGTSIKTMQRCLMNLEKTGHLWRETWKEGMYTRRRIWLAAPYSAYLLRTGRDDPKFKKCLRMDMGVQVGWTSVSGSDGHGCPSNKKRDKYKKKEREEPPPPAAPPDPSPAARAVSVFLFEQLKRVHPSHKSPSFPAWDKEVERMLRVDGRDPEEAKKIVAWAAQEGGRFWPTAIQSPFTLRKLYDRALIQMRQGATTPVSPKTQAERLAHEAQERADRECDNRAQTTAWLHKNGARLRAKNVTYYDTSDYIEIAGKKLEFASPNFIEDFKKIIRSLYL